MGKLWSDLNSDKERIKFLRSGQAVNTGIMAPAIVPDIIGVYEYRAAQKEEEAPGAIDNNDMVQCCKCGATVKINKEKYHCKKCFNGITDAQHHV